MPRTLALFAVLAFATPAPASDTLGGRDETAWRAAMHERESAVSERQAAVEACEAREAPPAYDGVASYVTRGKRDRRLRFVEIKRCDDERDALAAAREALDRFEEEARRLGVPPGWLR